MKILRMIILLGPVTLFVPGQGCWLPPQPTPLFPPGPQMVPVGAPTSPGWA